jgi:chromosomal replication initiator protein
MLRHSSTIISDTAQAFNVPLDRMLSASAVVPLAYARFAAMKIIREQRHLSIQTIARLLKRKDHTTVLNGLRRADELIANDPGFADAYRRAAQ